MQILEIDRNMSEQLMYHLISAMILEEKVMFYELIEIGKKGADTSLLGRLFNSLMSVTFSCNLKPLPFVDVLYFYKLKLQKKKH